MHWAAKYIGIPFEPGARGPEKVDCWGLVVLAYRQEFKIELPLYPGFSINKPVEAATAMRQGLVAEWTPIPIPIEGCLVAMSQRTEIHHIGLYLEEDGGKVLHAFGSQKVVADTTKTLRLKGMKLIKFYLHRQWPTS